MSVTIMRQHAVNILDKLFQERDLSGNAISRPSGFWQSVGKWFRKRPKKTLISRVSFFKNWPFYDETWPSMELTPAGWESYDSALADIFLWIQAQVTPLDKKSPDILINRLPEQIWPIMGRIRAFMTTDLPFPNRDPRLPVQNLLLTIPLASNILDGDIEPAENLDYSGYRVGDDDEDWDDAMDLAEMVSPRSVQSIRRERCWPTIENEFWPFTRETWTKHGHDIFNKPLPSTARPPSVDRLRRDRVAHYIERACRERAYLNRLETVLHGPDWRKRWNNSVPVSGFMSMQQFWEECPFWMLSKKYETWREDPVFPAMKSWLSCQHDATQPFSHIMAACYEDAVWPVLERCRRFLRTDLEFPVVEPAFIEFKPLMFEDYSQNMVVNIDPWPSDARDWTMNEMKYGGRLWSPNPWVARQERYWPLEGDEVWPFPPDTNPQYVRDLVKRYVGMA
ncbi:MAG: hypothetical protein H7833_18190 [Magnetococcus sp. DMHC-1]